MSKILICDDEKDIVNAVKIYLSSNPEYQLLEASNGQEAVDIVKNGDIDLVLMDIMMPVMDGIEALSEIRKFSNIPIILLTAKSEDTDVILGLNVGADDYITKASRSDQWGWIPSKAILEGDWETRQILG